MRRFSSNALFVGAFLVVLTAAVNSAYAQKYTKKPAGGYGLCGNGVLERKPNGSGAEWGEETCDGGQMMLDHLNAGGSAEQSEACYYTEKYGCQVRPDVHNNGIIERINSVQEDCDDGNDDPSDGCHAGHFTAATRYPVPNDQVSLCGNGVLDPGEVCDAGKSVYEDGVCENYSINKCQNFRNPSDPRSSSGYRCDLPTAPEDLCGNNRVDPNTGEQCDNGRMNGKDGICTEVCTLEATNPLFKRDTFYFYGDVTSGQLDKRAVLRLGSKPLDPRKSDKYSVYDRGRVVRIERDRGQQYSGIVPSTVPFDVNKQPLQINFNLRSADTYRFDNDWFGIVIGVSEQVDKETNENKYLMLAWRDKNNEGFNSSNDYANVEPSRCNGQVYAGDHGLKLYWITGKPDYNELWQMKDCGNGSNRHITEIPTDYQPSDSKLGDNNMTSINDSLGNAARVTEALGALPGGTSKTWNNMVNAAYRWSPFYYRDIIKYDAPREDNVVQIGIKYTKEGMDVWVNHQKVISINSDILGEDWPQQGQWGFYFLGMDNFIADFRSPENRVLNQPQDWFTIRKKGDDVVYNLNEQLNSPKGIRCEYCGDGVRQDVTGTGHYNEECDAGHHTVEGCLATCRRDTGWMCDTNENPALGTYRGEPTVCYTGTIAVPNPDVAKTLFSTATPQFEGSYKGSVGRITIHVDKGGSELCSGDAVLDSATQKWSFDTTSCNFVDGDDYTVYFKMRYNDRTVDSQVLRYPDSGGVPFQIATQGPEVRFTTPLESPIYLKHLDRIAGTFATKSAIALTASYSWVPVSSLHSSGFTDRSLLKLTPKTSSSLTGTWESPLGPSDNGIGRPAGADDGRYTFKVHATNSSPVESDSYADVVIDNGVPRILKIESDRVVLIDGQAIEEKDGAVDVSGVVSGYSKDEAPVFVTVTMKNRRTNRTEVRKSSSSPSVGNFVIKVPVPSDSNDEDTFSITVKVEDLAGNKSEKSIGASPTDKGIRVVKNGPIVNRMVVTPGDGGASTYTFKESKPGQFTVNIDVGPQHPTLLNDIRVGYCYGSGCLPSPVPCMDYDFSTGRCKLLVTHAASDVTKDVTVKAVGRVGAVALPAVEQRYHVDNRDFSGAGNVPSVALTPTPDSSGQVVLDGVDELQFVVTGNGVTQGGDTAVVVVNNRQKTCQLDNAKRCTITYPKGEVVGSQGKIDVAVKVRNDAKSETDSLTKVYTPTSYSIAIEDPVAGANVAKQNCRLHVALSGGVPGAEVKLTFATSGGQQIAETITLNDRGTYDDEILLADTTNDRCHQGPFDLTATMTAFDPADGRAIATATTSRSGINVSWTAVDPTDLIEITSPASGSYDLATEPLHVIVEGGHRNESVEVVVTDRSGAEVYRSTVTFNDKGIVNLPVTGLGSENSPYTVNARVTRLGHTSESHVSGIVVTRSNAVPGGPLLISEPSSSSAQLDEEGKLRVVIANGQPNSTANVKVIGADGQSKTTTVTFDSNGNLSSAAELPEGSSGPYRIEIQATAKDGSAVTQDVPGIAVTPQVKTFEIESPRKGATTMLAENGKLPVVVKGGKQGDRVRVEIIDADQNHNVVTGEIDADGYYRDEIALPAGFATGPFEVRISVNGKTQLLKGVTVERYDAGKGGKKGCGCASTTPIGDNFLSFLLLAFGLTFVRRRRWLFGVTRGSSVKK